MASIEITSDEHLDAFKRKVAIRRFRNKLARLQSLFSHDEAIERMYDIGVLDSMANAFEQIVDTYDENNIYNG